MQHLRPLLLRYRGCFAVLLACTLAVRLCVPSGFMPVSAGDGVSLQPCFGMVASPAAGMHRHGGAGHDHGRADRQCPFAAAGLSFVGGVDPLPGLGRASAHTSRTRC